MAGVLHYRCGATGLFLFECAPDSVCRPSALRASLSRFDQDTLYNQKRLEKKKKNCIIEKKEVLNVAYRKKMNPRKDKKVFTNTAKSTKKINVNPKPSRGGIRL